MPNTPANEPSKPPPPPPPAKQSPPDAPAETVTPHERRARIRRSTPRERVARPGVADVAADVVALAQQHGAIRLTLDYDHPSSAERVRVAIEPQGGAEPLVRIASTPLDADGVAPDGAALSRDFVGTLDELRQAEDSTARQ